MASRGIAARLASVPKSTVWSEMTPLAIECGAINLGQGFPNFHPPQFVIDHVKSTAIDATAALNHQYCRGLGHLTLVRQLQRQYGDLLGRSIAENEIVVTNGTTQALNVVCQALLDQGDEVITFLPAFDLYANDVQMAGGVVKYVAMKPSNVSANDWVATEEQIRSLVTPKTKMILLNSPQNVPGKVWSRAELEMIAKIAVEHDLFVLSDEVYYRLVYDGQEHISIGSLPGMAERTIVVASAGKTFSCTGYKIGWIVALPHIITACNQVQAHQSFSIATPLQIAVGKSMETASEPNNTYYEDLKATYTERRSQLMKVLADSGLTPVVPSGGFFILADISEVDPVHYVDPNEKTVGLDWQFCRWLTRHIGVNAIPTSAFCTPETRGTYEKYVRFAFCKREEDILAAGERLKKLLDYRRK